MKMASKPKRNVSFLDIDSKIIENNLTFQECKATDLSPYNALFGINEPWKVVTPKPGICVKTYDPDDKKVFVNICTLDEIPEPKDVDEDSLLELIESSDAVDYRVPLSLQEPREQVDKSGNPAVCYDVAINPRFLAKVQTSEVFKLFLIQVVFDGLNDKFNINLSAQEYTVLTKTKCIGTLVPHRIRGSQAPPQLPPPPKKLIQEIKHHALPPAQTKQRLESLPRHRFLLVKQDSKDYLFGEIHLSKVNFAKDICLKVGTDRLVVELIRGGTIIDINWPILIQPSLTTSQFSTSTKVLQFISQITPGNRYYAHHPSD